MKRIIAFLLAATMLLLLCGCTVALGGSDVGEWKSYEISDEIEKLDIEAQVAELEIIASDSFLVKSNYKHIEVHETDGRLEISDRSRGGVVLGFSEKTRLEIYIPEDWVFEKVNIEGGAGVIQIATLSTEVLSLTLGAGDVTVDTLNVYNRGDIEGGTGEVKICGGTQKDLEISMGVGDWELTGKLKGRCELSFGVGDADIHLIGSAEDYSIEANKGVGSVTLDGASMSGNKVYGSGATEIELNCGVGDIDISFVGEKR